MATSLERGARGAAAPEPSVRKIAVLRANGIGDFMFALPALEALRAAYPAAEIVLLAADWHREFLEGRPGPVDRVVAVPPSTGVREEPGRLEDGRAMETFFREIQAERFDLAVQMHGGGRHSNPFVRRLGARLTIGLRTPDAVPLDRVVPYVYFQSEVLRYLEVVSLVGAAPAGLEPRLHLAPGDVEESREVVPANGTRPIVVIHPAASDPRRRWPAPKFGQVAAALARQGARVFAVGVAPDAHLASDVAASSGGAAEDICGRLSLRGLTGLLSRSALVVSNDSGPLHLGAAVGAATVGIYWCGNLITAGPLTRARHRPFISWQLHCPECGVDTIRQPCPHRPSFVADVAVDDVVAGARDVLAQERDTVGEGRDERDAPEEAGSAADAAAS